ncbi:uncharacterized protein MYCFIDRAFT_176016 [Pseudocercospora fijiensis CIRAD86]|uniref:Uncharacterized protein n=1 Tax=Pseudocercospora fijiensis (strain CIRAD86) TaxID=383855 RepID=M2YXP3_PSEFD|nr:uncharacterized protein MYCFIDRAFT_176016 [Pseudocercospora fijiensis CIRAD86]EME82470.1 hypothetical protein MYCFIDRAFT_176016 [Pseudocercospora fijiensis CIRAD86]
MNTPRGRMERIPELRQMLPPIMNHDTIVKPSEIIILDSFRESSYQARVLEGFGSIRARRKKTHEVVQKEKSRVRLLVLQTAVREDFGSKGKGKDQSHVLAARLPMVPGVQEGFFRMRPSGGSEASRHEDTMAWLVSYREDTETYSYSRIVGGGRESETAITMVVYEVEGTKALRSRWEWSDAAWLSWWSRSGRRQRRASAFVIAQRGGGDGDGDDDGRCDDGHVLGDWAHADHIFIAGADNEAVFGVVLAGERRRNQDGWLLGGPLEFAQRWLRKGSCIPGSFPDNFTNSTTWSDAGTEQLLKGASKGKERHTSGTRDWPRATPWSAPTESGGIHVRAHMQFRASCILMCRPCARPLPAKAGACAAASFILDSRVSSSPLFPTQRAFAPLLPPLALPSITDVGPRAHSPCLEATSTLRSAAYLQQQHL